MTIAGAYSLLSITVSASGSIAAPIFSLPNCGDILYAVLQSATM
jgi:hypothetical protein